jgi:hypothetical protein
MPLWWIALSVYLVWVSFLCVKAVAKGLKHGMEPPPVPIPPPVVPPMSLSDRMALRERGPSSYVDILVESQKKHNQRLKEQMDLWKEIEDLIR